MKKIKDMIAEQLLSNRWTAVDKIAVGVIVALIAGLLVEAAVCM